MLDVNCSRRRLIGGAFALGAAGMIAGPAGAAPWSFAGSAERRLAFRNVHTNEKVDARYFGANGYDSQGLAEINHGLRDWRTGDTEVMDRDLLDLLGDLRRTLGFAPSKQIDIICGYRSPKTNQALQARGGARSGVATHSQHMLGKATDISISGASLDRVRLAALSLKRGGVGYYPRDGFVHVDTGSVRTW